MATLRAALVLTALTVVLLGGLYPLAVLGIGSAAFPSQAGGSLVEHEGHVVGSSLIGQRFASERYFHGRPSAAGKDGYDATASTGSNLGPTSRALAERIAGERSSLAKSDGESPPVDLVTASASGLDPHISPEAARYQIRRVAAARTISRSLVEQLVARHIELPTLGLLGEPRVNVLLLNLDLDTIH